MMAAKQANTRGSADGDHHGAQQAASSPNPKSAQKLLREKSGPPKTSPSYWLSKVRKPAGSQLYGVQISYKGERNRFPLETPNKEAAAEKARKIYLSLVSNGTAATLATFKLTAAPAAGPANFATIGQLISTAARLSSARRESLDTYSKALRRIVAGVLDMDSENKFSKNGGTTAWRDAIDAVPLDRLTPAAVLEWKNAFLRAAPGPQERNAAAVTVNSLLRNSKALLSKRIRPFLEKELSLPPALWFQDVPQEKEPSMRYRSTIDAGKILKSGVEELQDEPEVFKALLLTLVCGLRRSEADSLQWDQIDLTAGTLDVRDTASKALKSADSAGTIALDTEITAIFRGFHARASGPFVLETPDKARKFFREHKSRTYRCDATHARLLAWLRSHGVNGKRPMHTLRKEIGSIIATEQGIFAASRYLRHSDIRITSKLYADSKTLIAANLGGLLAGDATGIIKGKFAPVKSTNRKKKNA